MTKQAIRLQLLRLAGAVLCRLAPKADLPATPAPAILVIRPDHLGDVLLTLPAIDRLVGGIPGARITVAAGPWGSAAFGTHPDYEVLAWPFPGFSRAPAGGLRPYLLLLRYGLSLRRSGRYQMALIMRPDHWWGALLAAVAGIPVRIGYRTPETAPFLTDALPHAPGRHAVEDSLTLVGAALARARVPHTRESSAALVLPRVSSAADEQSLTELLNAAGVGREPLIVLHPGSGSPLKSWPTDHFAKVGAELAEATEARLVVTGSAAEAPLASALCAALPEGTLNLAGRLQWPMLEALLARACLVVGVDSGPLHLAVAAGTPSVALFGPADPVQFGPWGSPSMHRVVAADLPCIPCRRLDVCRLEPQGTEPPPCMRAISTGTVVAAARAALAEGSL
ncbi:MAG: glycosyl transferase family 9 [Chloroflexi bacterium]|nr:glycosyl transferase family 9 [Chloroflexota bacterium]